MKKIIAKVAIALLLTGVINSLPLASKKTPSMEKHEYPGLILYAEPKDSSEVERIARRLILCRERVATALKTKDPQTVNVYIYPDHKTLHRKTLGILGIFLPDWYIGKNGTDHILITSPGAPGPSHSRESVEQAVVHEFVHLLTDRRNKKMTYWLKEGFALYLAEQKPEASSVTAHRDITYGEFADTNAIRFANSGGYYLAYSLIEFLDEQYGWERTLGFLEPQSDTESVLGVGEKELFRQWKAWLENYS